jgi:hypothetical protein
MPCDPDNTLVQACSSGIGKIRDPLLLQQLIAQLTCEAAQASGSGQWLLAANNLSDVDNAVTARSNLGYLVQVIQQQPAFTGSTNETTIATIQIPGGAMGANGFMRILIFWSGTGASNKQMRLRGGPSDTELLSAGTSQATFMHLSNILNQNSESSQITAPVGSPVVYGGSSLSLSTTAIDTSVDWELDFTMQLTNSSDSSTLRRAVIETIYLP